MLFWVAALLLLACVLFWLWAIAPQVVGKPDFTELKKFDYAHRGLHQKETGVPENSLLAFRLAADCGFGMELDLQLTKDNRVVVHHDHSILRTCGVDKRISDMTYEELKGYRLFGTEERIPLFSEVLALVQGKTPLIVELKGYHDGNTLCALAVEELKAYRGLYCVESFDPQIVRWFRQNQPGIIRGQLMERLQRGKNGMTGPQAFFGRNLMTNFLTRPNFEAYDFQWRNNFSLQAARRVFGMQEVSWTLRSEEDFRRAKAAGNLCIFEHILPVKAEEWKERSFEELLRDRKAVALAERKAAPVPRAR